jgi:hypothetical protein
LGRWVSTCDSSVTLARSKEVQWLHP